MAFGRSLNESPHPANHPAAPPGGAARAGMDFLDLTDGFTLAMRGRSAYAPLFALRALDGRRVEMGREGPRSSLMFFLSPSCPVCKQLLPLDRAPQAALAGMRWVTQTPPNPNMAALGLQTTTPPANTGAFARSTVSSAPAAAVPFRHARRAPKSPRSSGSAPARIRTRTRPV